MRIRALCAAPRTRSLMARNSCPLRPRAAHAACRPIAASTHLCRSERASLHFCSILSSLISAARYWHVFSRASCRRWAKRSLSLCCASRMSRASILLRSVSLRVMPLNIAAILTAVRILANLLTPVMPPGTVDNAAANIAPPEQADASHRGRFTDNARPELCNVTLRRPSIVDVWSCKNACTRDEVNSSIKSSSSLSVTIRRHRILAHCRGGRGTWQARSID